MVLRVLLFLALIAAGWWLWRKRARVRPPVAPPAAAAGPRALPPAETMVDCARCGLHLPASEALRDDTALAYCCAEHRAAGPRDVR